MPVNRLWEGQQAKKSNPTNGENENSQTMPNNIKKRPTRLMYFGLFQSNLSMRSSPYTTEINLCIQTYPLSRMS